MWLTGSISRPLDSCLNPTHPSTTDLARLLNLLVFSQKYLVHRLQAHITSLVAPLTQPSTISSHLKNGLSPLRVIEVATILNDKNMRAAARSVVLEDLWLDPGRDTTRDAVDPYDALIYGETVGDKEVIGASYYRILVSWDRHKPWDVRLSQSHIQTLHAGRDNLLDLWRERIGRLGKGYYASKPDLFIFNTPGGIVRQGFLHGLWVAISAEDLVLWDLVGLYRVIIKTWVSVVGETGVDVWQGRLELIQQNMYDTFVQEASEATSTS